MAWFSFLKSQGYFSSEKNQAPIEVKGGFQIPYWEALRYLEKLSEEIRGGKELELIDELLSIVKDVSEHPKDNYRTWYVLIKVLANLPNEKISKDILNFIPVWLAGKFDTMIQTSELCDKLIPKFLNENPTADDIEKAELILHYLFQVNKVEINNEDISEEEVTSYGTRVYLHFLSDAFKKRELRLKIVKHCSNNFLLELGSTIKKLLLDHPNGIETTIKNGKQEYEIRIYIDNGSLLISSKLKGGEIELGSSSLSNYEDLEEKEIKQALCEILKQHGIIYSPTNDDSDAFEWLNYALNNDSISPFVLKTIGELEDSIHHDESALYVYSLIFRDLLNEKAGQNPEEAVSLLRIFCFDKRYRIPVFGRMALYVVGKHWNEMKILFWELVGNNDALHFFSKHKYKRDLYELLNKNQQHLTESEKTVLQKIIDRGEQEEINRNDEKHFEYWQLRWYSALKNTEPFRGKYLEHTELLNIPFDHFENSRRTGVRSGSISPISKSDLLQKSNQEIAEMLVSFQPKDRWEEPNISGLSEVFGNAIETEPHKFANEIDLYKNVGYIYAYKMFYAFSEAWRKQKPFSWENVLLFCLSYIKNERFYSEGLVNQNDGWNAKADWVVGSIANLLKDGMQNDGNSFDIKLLPLAKEIIQILCSNLKLVDDVKKENMDYPTYSYNSTAGKVLRALFDYSLRRARNLFKHEDKGKWEPEMRSMFEETLRKGILDGHIIEGIYFEQFYFLDKEWIIEETKKHYKIGEREWLAFINGYVVNNSLCSKDIYDLFYPHFDKAIENSIEIRSFQYNGVVRHITAFYFWGFETLADHKLVWKFINMAKPSHVVELVNFFSQQKDYVKGLTKTKRSQFDNIILTFWTYLANKYENTEVDEEQKILSALANFLVFVTELNETYTHLVLKSCMYVSKDYSTHRLIENLVSLKNKGNLLVAAKSVGEIITVMEFKDYIIDDDQTNIIELISFLFENGQDQSAINFCNRMAVNQQFFLRETYERFTSDHIS